MQGTHRVPPNCADWTYKPCTQVFRKLETGPDAEYVKVMNTKAITEAGEPCNEDSPDVCEWREHREMCCAAGTQGMAGRQLSAGSQPASQPNRQTAAFRQAGRVDPVTPGVQ